MRDIQDTFNLWGAPRRGVVAGLAVSIGIFSASCRALDTDPGTPGSVLAPKACDVPLGIVPAGATVRPHDLVSFAATGGSGQVRFELTTSASGGDVHPTRGAYVAGDTPDVQDAVRVVDAVCGTEATARVQVVSGLQVVPRQAQVRPGTGWTWEVSGGSGEATCALAVNASGGSVSADCAYVAGDVEGQDTVRVTDARTGETLDAWVAVGSQHGMRVGGQGGVFLPERSLHRFTPVGGSGHVVVSVLEGDLDVEGDAIIGGAGSGRVRVADRFTDEAVEVPVQVLAPRLTRAPRDGERSNEGVALAAGDLNGDGWPDAVVASTELSLAAHLGGGVLVFAGGPAGLDAAPAQTFAGAGSQDTFGRAVVLADVNLDGQTDLLIGADRQDRGYTNNGAVHLHLGIEGGLFAPTPTVWVGPQDYDRLGSALAVCDFDGDGWPDLAAGAVDATDRNAGTQAEDQGAVFVYRGSADGYSERADFVLYGQVLEDGAWVGAPALGMGASLAAGDLDGDGLCDLAAGAPDAHLFGGASEDGAVFVFAGTQREGLMLTREPVAVLAASRGDDGELGRSLAIADLDGQPGAELVVTHWQSDARASTGGAVRVFPGPEVMAADVADPLAPDDAAWWVGGLSASDYLGASVALRDADGDGSTDVVVGAYRAEDGLYGQGLVYAFTDVASQLSGAPFDASDVGPSHVWAGLDRYDRFGQAVDVLGDVDGDGAPDLIVLAGYAAVVGIEAGAPYQVSGATGTMSQLGWPGSAAGHDYGQALGGFDVDGDGDQDLIVGAPGAGSEQGANAGIVEAWTGAEGAAILGGHDHHSASDRFGFAVDGRGDVDGDGYPDLIVVARSDAAPTDFGPDIVNPDACTGYRSSAGSVLVYRGGPIGLASTPSFVWFGPQEGGYVRTMASGFDHNGDGYDDIVVGSTDWGDGGGVALIHGQAANLTGTTVLCDAQVHLGTSRFDRMGAAVAGLGDVDGDGCDEVAFGATGEELHDDWYNQGVVRVLWGWGGPGCATTPEVSALAVKVVGTELGEALAGGGDVDGDGVPDLVVSGAAYRTSFAEVGVTWLVPGAWLGAVARQAMPGGALPQPEATSWSLLLPEQGLRARYGLVGQDAGGLWGASLALLPDPMDPARSMVAVGAPQANVGGVNRGGGALWFRFLPDQDGFDAVPYGVLSGEDTGAGALGTVMWAGQVDGHSVLAVGAPTSDQGGVDLGAAYVVPLQ